MSEQPASSEWKLWEKLFFRFIFIYVLLFANSFSCPHHFIPDIGKFTSPFFETMVKWSGATIFRMHHPFYWQLVSDSTGFYIHAFNLIFISAFSAIVWSCFGRTGTNYNRLQYWFFAGIRYYLALQLFEYGFSKFFKCQFYLPEPNTLFTTIGNTPKDLLYWSCMGTSRFYSMFTGSMEVFAAAFLLFRKTFLFGAILSFGILFNVLMLNFGFDISVKLYSCFLILLSVILIYPSAKKLFQLFFSGKTITFEKTPVILPLAKNRKIHGVLKVLIVGIILGDTLSPYFKSGDFNDDNFPRPYMHGAYNVVLFVKNSDTLSNANPEKWKRVFIHRQGYFITQNSNDEMDDYELDVDSFGKKLIIEKGDGSIKTFFNYSQTSDSTFSLRGRFKNDSLVLLLKKIDLRKLPLFQEGFHWTIDN